MKVLVHLKWNLFPLDSNPLYPNPSTHSNKNPQDKDNVFNLKPPKKMPRSCKVAVIGAGVSGLAAARELFRQGHAVTVFEQSDRVGGTWIYTPETDSDPLSLDPTRKIVHCSLYRSLRTNLPRPIMEFSDYPFTESFGGDPRSFPAHEEVAAFLEGFARESRVLERVRFGAEVVRVRMGDSKREWVVESRRVGKMEVEMFEAVVVCNGHHTEPKVAEIGGIGKWPGKQIHSHNYRVPEPFKDQIVVIIGRGPSAQDISRDIATVAKEVHLASRSPDIEVGKLNGYSNIWQHSMIRYVKEDGAVVFNDGAFIPGDVILHCTGYKYHFPFLDTKETVSIDDNRVGPLYKHLFPPHLAPWLSFVGLLNKAMIFTLAELQSKWVANVLSEKTKLPSEEDMIASIKEDYLQMEKLGMPKHSTHALHPNEIEFLNWLAAEVGSPPIETWRSQLYRSLVKNITSPEPGYRDSFDADYWIQQSQLHLQRLQISE